MKAIEKVTCKEFYLQLINIDVHNPSSVKNRSSQYPIFKETSTNVWPRIFKLPFITIRDTKIQTFQYRLIQKTIPCNKWVHNIKIKNCCVCDYCMNVDDLPHFFTRCINVKEIWLHWINRWKNFSGIVIRNSQELKNAYYLVFHPIVMLCKYLTFVYYTQNIISISNVYLIMTHLTSIPCLTQLKQALKTEENICIKIIRKKHFSGTTLSMKIYKAIMKILYVIMYLRLCIRCLK